jgi:hypothetical protein
VDCGWPCSAHKGQQQNSTQKKERALEEVALRNKAKFQNNGASLAPGDHAKDMRMIANCDPANHSCTYTLSGAKNTYYVWEHQTASGGGRDNRGPGDNTSGGLPNKFEDLLLGGNETYRFFTVLTSANYDPTKQIPIMIQEGV